MQLRHIRVNFEYLIRVRLSGNLEHMMDAMRIGLNGMKVAETQVAARSRNIVNVATPGYRPVEPIVKSAEDGPRAIIRERPLVPELALVEGTPLPPVNLAEEIVHMRAAQHAYKASAKVVETASRMSREAIDILG